MRALFGYTIASSAKRLSTCEEFAEFQHKCMYIKFPQCWFCRSAKHRSIKYDTFTYTLEHSWLTFIDVLYFVNEITRYNRISLNLTWSLLIANINMQNCFENSEESDMQIISFTSFKMVSHIYCWLKYLTVNK